MVAGGGVGLRLQSLLGLAVLLSVAWLLSESRRRIAWRFVLTGVALQGLLAFLFLHLPGSGALFGLLNRGVLAIQHATLAGTSFVFGYVGGAAPPFVEANPGASVVLAFQILPLIIVVSALAALLTWWRVLPAIVRALAWLFERTLGLGGAIALACAANPFLGMVESAILVRPYLPHLTRSEFCLLMCTGLAGVAGTVLVLYATFLAPVIPDAAGHLLIASLVSLPGALVIGRMLVPESQAPTAGDLPLHADVQGSFDALTHGTRQGLELFLNIVAVLLVCVALVHLLDAFLHLLPQAGGAPLSLERMAGWLFAPLAWLLGVASADAPRVGSLLGTKLVLNELIAYRELGSLGPGVLSERSRLIATYALCGFANFGSVGILVSALGTMAPRRRAEVASLGWRALLGGTLATCATAAIVGILS